MNIFYGGIFIEKEKLEKEGIKYPIKLEYYKNINSEQVLKQNKYLFGISVVKTEYMKDKTRVERKDIKYLSNDEQRINAILELCKENEVTPIAFEDVICEYIKNEVFYNI